MYNIENTIGQPQLSHSLHASTKNQLAGDAVTTCDAKEGDAEMPGLLPAMLSRVLLGVSSSNFISVLILKIKQLVDMQRIGGAQAHLAEAQRAQLHAQDDAQLQRQGERLGVR